MILIWDFPVIRYALTPRTSRLSVDRLLARFNRKWPITFVMYIDGPATKLRLKMGEQISDKLDRGRCKDSTRK